MSEHKKSSWSSTIFIIFTTSPHQSSYTVKIHQKYPWKNKNDNNNRKTSEDNLFVNLSKPLDYLLKICVVIEHWRLWKQDSSLNEWMQSNQHPSICSIYVYLWTFFSRLLGNVKWNSAIDHIWNDIRMKCKICMISKLMNVPNTRCRSYNDWIDEQNVIPC